MGARPRTLLTLTSYKEKIRSEAPTADVDKLLRIATVRPKLKVYVDQYLSVEELERLRSTKAYDGALLIFDPLDGSLNPEDVIKRRPLLHFYNGRLPSFKTLDNATRTSTCDGLLIVFKQLRNEEKEYCDGN